MAAPKSSSASTAISVFTDHPDGQTWVLIRGLIRSRYHWAGFPERLQQQPWAGRLILPEVAGNGERSSETTPSGVHAMMEDVRQQALAETGGHKKLTLLAISMGAMIATEWAVCYPDEIEALHLINTSFGRFSKASERMHPTMALKLLRVLATTRGNPAGLEAIILQLTVNGRINPEILGDWVNFARQHPMRVRNILTQVWSASRYQGPAAAPVCRTYIYHSWRDRLVSGNCSRHIALAWQKPLHTHPTAGHDLPLEDPDWLIERISQSMSALPQDH